MAEAFVKTKSLRSKKLQSLTVLAIIDGQSSELTKGMSPYLDKTPYEGLKPKSPVNVAGFRAEPPVSDPKLLKIYKFNILYNEFQHRCAITKWN